uniref:Thioredoxin domain-containing protein n=1 Tax=Romanomermis culicivorax TaxID=13658 RepID=A0A915HSH8_ROMCU
MAAKDFMLQARLSEAVSVWHPDPTTPSFGLNPSSNPVDFGFRFSHPIPIGSLFSDQDCPEAQFVKNLSFILDVLDFGMTSKPEVFEHYDIASDGIVLFKNNVFIVNFFIQKIVEDLKPHNQQSLWEMFSRNFDERKAIYEGIYDKESVINWLHTSYKIFGGKLKSHYLLFISKTSPNYESNLEIFKNVAAKFRGRIIFVVIDLDEEKEIEDLVKLFAVNKDMAPVFRILFFEEDMIKYKPENEEITEENIAMFAQDYLEKKLKPYYLSQDLPDDWNFGSVWTLVSSNFEEVTKRSGKNPSQFFAGADWSTNCNEIEPVIKKLGDHYNRTGQIIVARIDAMLNEFEHIKVEILPTIKLFIANSDEVIEYDGNKSFTSLKRFVDSNGTEDAKKVVDEMTDSFRILQKHKTQESQKKDEL